MSEIMPGVEVYGSIAESRVSLEDSSVVRGLETYAMDSQAYMGPVPAGQKVDPPIIMIDPQSKLATIYLNSTTQLSNPQYVTPLCVFLDNTAPDFTIRMYLGSGIDDNHMIGIASIIYSMQHCKAQIETYAYGMCSIPESMIWSYGAVRHVGAYGCVRFGGGEWIRRMETAFKPYIQTYMDHCRSLKLLTDEQIETIMVKQKEYMLMLDPKTQSLVNM